jgi:AcrR family transcriptional regulator
VAAADGPTETGPDHYRAGMARTTRRPRGRPPAMPDHVREAVVLDAATALFARDGLHATTMDAIAAAAGVRKPNLYRQFASKDDAYAAVVEHACGQLEIHLLRTYADVEGLDEDEQARQCVGAIFELADRYPDAFRIVFSTERPSSEPAAERIDLTVRRVTQGVAQLLRREFAARGTPTEATEAIAEAIVGMCLFAARRVADEPDWSGEHVAQLLAAFTVAGLKGLPQWLLGDLD